MAIARVEYIGSGTVSLVGPLIYNLALQRNEMLMEEYQHDGGPDDQLLSLHWQENEQQSAFGAIEIEQLPDDRVRVVFHPVKFARYSALGGNGPSDAERVHFSQFVQALGQILESLGFRQPLS